MTTSLTYWPTIAKIDLQARFEEALMTNVDEDDSSKVGIVSIGKYLGDPARVGVYVEIYENDPDSDSWYHEVERKGGEGSPEYVGGIVGFQRSRWMRRFVDKVHVFRKGVGQEAADVIRGAVVSRIEAVLLNYPSLGALTDTGGEVAQFGRIVRERGHLSGDDKTPMWRYSIFIEFKTDRKQVIQ